MNTFALTSWVGKRYLIHMAKKSTINKSAVSGKIVSAAAAAKSPSTTYKQTVMKGPVKKRAK